MGDLAKLGISMGSKAINSVLGKKTNRRGNKTSSQIFISMGHLKLKIKTFNEN